MLNILYKRYRGAALAFCDLQNGDGNVGCLGLHNIDPLADGEIVIEFDLPKLLSIKPAAFYKQKDLEFKKYRIREVNLGEKILKFQHTHDDYIGNPAKEEFSYFKLDYDSDSLITKLPKSILISYNLEQMNEILTLNFFRFLDSGALEKSGLSAEVIYQEINQLGAKELVRFLTDLRREMTDTAEFNFYGAHQIDFSTVKSISNRVKDYTLHFDQFIEALNQGKINELHQSRLMIPNLFQSYRFLDYLLKKVKHQEARYYLEDFRKQCCAPAWVNCKPRTQFFSKSQTHAADEQVAELKLS